MSAEQVPPSVSDAMGNAGDLPTIAWNGKSYPVEFPDVYAIQRVEKEVARLAWENVGNLKAAMPPAAWAELKAETVAAIQSRQWAFGFGLFASALAGPDGDSLILWGCMAGKSPGLTLGDVSRMQSESAADCEFALLMVQAPFFAAGAATLTASPEKRERVAAEATAAVKQAQAKQSRA
jgi:hypothetical protein